MISPIIPLGAVPIPPPATPVSRPNQIYWIWTNGNCDTPIFPLPGGKSGPGSTAWRPRALDDFLESVATVKDSLLILDPFFDAEVGLSSMWGFLQMSSASDVRILVSKPDCKRSLDDWIRTTPGKIAVKAARADLEFHDRFAVLDRELWHFGSTVGGAHPEFGAATRGWDATDFRTVFDSLWRRVV